MVKEERPSKYNVNVINSVLSCSEVVTPLKIILQNIYLFKNIFF